MSTVTNFTTAYDSIIQEGLRRVNREQEYIASEDNEIDQSRKNSYREIFTFTLRELLMKFGVFWASTTVKLTQGEDLENGFAYLPKDFVAFLNPNTLQVDYTQEVIYTAEGQAITGKAGSEITYLKQPKVLDEFPPAFVEVLIYGFLVKCGLRDVNWTSTLPLLREEYNNSVQYLERVTSDAVLLMKQRSSFNPFHFG